MTENVRAVVQNAADNPKAAMLEFQAREREEEISFRITTSAPILSSHWWLPQLKGEQWLSQAESRGQNHYAISLDRKFLDRPFIVGLELDVEDDPKNCIVAAEIWDRSGSDPDLIFIDFE